MMAIATSTRQWLIARGMHSAWARYFSVIAFCLAYFSYDSGRCVESSPEVSLEYLKP